MTIKLKSLTVQELARKLFIIFCMCPFIFQFPGLTSDNQPYALLFGLFLIVLYFPVVSRLINKTIYVKALVFTAFIATIVLIASGLTVGALRGYFNHLSLFVIPVAYAVCFKKDDGEYEKLVKAIFLIWLFVGVVQLLVSRSFMAQIIANARWKDMNRGVIGLAAEPSFFGISCFYFLHIAMKFKKENLKYMILVTAMGFVLAQSTTGIIFMLIFWICYLLENITSKKGIILFVLILLAVLAGYAYLSRYHSDLRVFKLVDTFLDEGFTSLYEGDESTSNRMNSIAGAIESFSDANFLPQGFKGRIGSGYGGFLCELGFFAVIELLVISVGFSLQFKKTPSRIVYFILISALLFSNTQIGNPQLLFVLGMNYYESLKSKKVINYEQNNKI